MERFSDFGNFGKGVIDINDVENDSKVRSLRFNIQCEEGRQKDTQVEAVRRVAKREIEVLGAKLRWAINSRCHKMLEGRNN